MLRLMRGNAVECQIKRMFVIRRTPKPQCQEGHGWTTYVGFATLTRVSIIALGILDVVNSLNQKFARDQPQLAKILTCITLRSNKTIRIRTKLTAIPSRTGCPDLAIFRRTKLQHPFCGSFWRQDARPLTPTAVSAALATDVGL